MHTPGVKNHAIFTDARAQTLASRLSIGFSPQEAWREAPAHFSDHTLVIDGHPVMEDWEDGYMRMLAQVAASGRGTVLEVGFGMGISAGYIQSAGVDRHIIIEANRDVYRKLEAFAAEHPSVTPLFGFWEEAASTLPSGSINGILFDTYPLTEADIHRNHFPFFKEAHRLLTPDGTLTYYSDEIDDYSTEHLEALTSAGFTRIGKSLCEVVPPEGCAYWTSRTLLAPVIQK